MQVDEAELRRLPLRAHDLLAEVPLHDVWCFQLTGGPPDLEVSDVIRRLASLEPSRVNRWVRALFALRAGLGRVLGWDRDEPGPGSRSFVHRLTAEDRERSTIESGSPQAFWTTLYAFEREALGEVINRTVHAFLLFALEPAPDGHTLYWGIYVRPVHRLTPLYMAAIDPFRRHVVYPAIIRRFEEDWQRAHRATGPRDDEAHSSSGRIQSSQDW